MSATLFLILHVAPEHGPQVIFVYIGICSIAGSLSVMSCKVGVSGRKRIGVVVMA